MDLQGKNVLIVGTGLSGISAARLVAKLQGNAILYDEDDKVKEDEIQTRLGSCKVEILTGEFKEDKMRMLDLAVLSPGVPLDTPFVGKLKSYGIKLWGEIELAYLFSKGRVLAITGTNGKTTTTALLGEIIKSYYKSVFVVGNIGNPYTDVVLDMKEETVTVAEISSFQLETIETFRPKVSAVLNITPDHLNRHKTMENYIAIKEKIAENQDETDTCVLNYDDPITRDMGKHLHTNIFYFSRLSRLDEGVYVDQDKIEYAHDGKVLEICKLSELKLLGSHNVENIMAAIAMAIHAEMPLWIIRNVVTEFKGVEHRIEFVSKIKGVSYYNDSKGTNTDAAIKGIQAMVSPTILIGGGYDKDSEYEDWINSFDGKVKLLILIGQTREKIAATARKCGFHDIILADTLEESVKIAANAALEGDAVLLSPACASWGMFKNYEERGRLFKEYVNKLEE